MLANIDHIAELVKPAKVCLVFLIHALTRETYFTKNCEHLLGHLKAKF